MPGALKTPLKNQAPAMPPLPRNKVVKQETEEETEYFGNGVSKESFVIVFNDVWLVLEEKINIIYKKVYISARC